MWLYVFECVHLYVCLFACAFVCVCMCLCVCICMCVVFGMYVFVCVCMCAFLRVLFACMCLHVCIWMCVVGSFACVCIVRFCVFVGVCTCLPICVPASAIVLVNLKRALKCYLFDAPVAIPLVLSWQCNRPFEVGRSSGTCAK